MSLSTYPISPNSVTSGSVKLEFKTENDSRDVFNSPLRPIKNLFLGFYRTTMAVWTVANLRIFYPGLPLLKQIPRIQAFCEKAAFHFGLNPTHPHIIELHLPVLPLSLEKIKVPCTDYQLTLPLPQFPVLTMHMLTDTGLNKAILKPHRHVVFDGGPISYDAAFNLLVQVFPETQFSREDFLLTCGPAFTSYAHRQIIKALNSQRLDKIIANEGEKLIDRWKRYSEYDCAFDVAKEMQFFTSAVITQAMFDNSDKHQELSEAVHFMNSYLYIQAVGKLIEGDKERFDQKCKVFRDAIDEILQGEDVDSLPLFQNGFTLAQKQALCLLLFFAGQETTAFALTHNLADLALNPSKQKSLFKAIQKAQNKKNPLINVVELKEFINNQLLKIPPVEAISRKLKTDGYISFKNENGKEVGKFIRRNERLAANIGETAKKVLEKGSNPLYRDASVFGEGVNGCIGKILALKELYQLPAIILSKLELITQESKFKFKNEVTNQAEPFLIKVRSKEPTT